MLFSGCQNIGKPFQRPRRKGSESFRSHAIRPRSRFRGWASGGCECGKKIGFVKWKKGLAQVVSLCAVHFVGIHPQQFNSLLCRRQRDTENWLPFERWQRCCNFPSFLTVCRFRYDCGCQIKKRERCHKKESKGEEIIDKSLNVTYCNCYYKLLFIFVLRV